MNSSERNQSAADARLSTERIHELLAARRRRYVLYCLTLYANPMQLSGVADQVAVWEYDEPIEDLWDESLDIYTALYHSHVPKLADADVVVYDESEDMIELGPNAPLLRPHLERLAADDL